MRRKHIAEHAEAEKTAREELAAGRAPARQPDNRAERK